MKTPIMINKFPNLILNLIQKQMKIMKNKIKNLKSQNFLKSITKDRKNIIIKNKKYISNQINKNKKLMQIINKNMKSCKNNQKNQKKQSKNLQMTYKILKKNKLNQFLTLKKLNKNLCQNLKIF